MGIGIGIGFGFGSNVSAWAPTAITSVPVVEYWEANGGIASGTTFAWTGSKGNVFAKSAANAPTFTASDAAANGQPSLIFTAASSHELVCNLALPAPGTSPRYYWLVARAISWGGNRALLSGQGGAAHILYQNVGTPRVFAYNGANSATGSAANLNATIGTTRIFSLSLTNSIADEFRVGGATPDTGVILGNGSAAGLVLGSFGGSGFCDLAVMALLITQGKPTEQALLNAYASKWGANVNS